jgi:hypothetical protein
MKRLLFAAAVVAATAASSLPARASDVALSVSIGQPGYYGRIDIGGYPPPRVIYGQPVVIEPVPVGRPPVYLNVPPGHAKHWQKNCYRYNACGERVYFVQNNWYQREYVPRYHQYATAIRPAIRSTRRSTRRLQGSLPRRSSRR